MIPQRNTNATLVDLLDRVLDKGLIIYADLIVSVAGIPLIGVNLRAALAGMETMLKYGIMQAWDEKSRARERENRNQKKEALIQGEEVIIKMLGALFSSEGIYTAWKYGYLYLTDKRLFLYHQDFGEILFETSIDKIQGFAVCNGEQSNEKQVRQEMRVLLEGGRVCRLTALNVLQVKESLEKQMEKAGLVFQKDNVISFAKENAPKFLADGEQVICTGKMWYLMGKEGITDDTWRSGHLYLTDKRACWYYDFARKIGIEIPVSGIKNSAMETRVQNEVRSKEKVMDLIYTLNGTRRVATFSGPLLEEWNQVLNTIGQRGVVPENETETCPKCGKTAPVKELLGNGCAACGWTSPMKTGKIGDAEIMA